jgi:hypothetical protein
MQTIVRYLLAAVMLPVILSGCILVRTTEHRIKLNDNGSGEALLRLIDIRSDEQADSLIQRDFDQMMKTVDKYGVDEFERPGRKVTGKQFVVHGDTLTLEISYTFQNVDAVEGLHVTKDGFTMGVTGSREVVKTNGTLEDVKQGFQQIAWDLSARRLMYIIREKVMPPSTPLTALYLKSQH